MAIRGESWEVFHVLHVGKNGVVWGPATLRFPNYSVTGLLDTWLNLPPDAVQFAPARNELTVSVPFRQGDNMVGRVLVLPLAAGSLLPIVGADEAQQTVQLQWPPSSSDPVTVSPEEESSERYGLSSASSGSMDSAAQDHPASTAVPVRIVWPEPVASLFPLVSSLDELHARDLMRDVVIDQSGNPEGALRRAQTESRDWVSEGRSNLAYTWLNPSSRRKEKRQR